MKLIKHDSFFNDPYTDLEKLFESTFPELYQRGTMRKPYREGSLPLDVYETKESRFVRVEIPGVKKKAIEISMENAVLEIKAVRQIQDGEKESSINLGRSITVGDDIDSDNVKARLEDGILTIELPKREQAKPRQIDIA